MARTFRWEEGSRMILKAVVGALAVLVLGAAPVAADPNNSNTLQRTLECDNGRTVDAVFAGENGSNFNVTVDQSVFIYKMLSVDRPPTGTGGDDTVDVPMALPALAPPTVPASVCVSPPLALQPPAKKQRFGQRIIARH